LLQRLVNMHRVGGYLCDAFFKNLPMYIYLNDEAYLT